MLTVTGIVGAGVAILVAVIVFGPSDPLEISKTSTFTRIVGVGVAILVTVIAFGPTDPVGISKMSTVTGIVKVGVTILITSIAFIWTLRSSGIQGSWGLGSRSSYQS